MGEPPRTQSSNANAQNAVGKRTYVRPRTRTETIGQRATRLSNANWDRNMFFDYNRYRNNQNRIERAYRNMTGGEL